ncbi:MAG: hypothetical protein WBP59_02180, partial [Ilumatobacteraceae bacterium]
ALLWVWRGDVLHSSNGLAPMILGLQPFVTSATSLDVPRITAWAFAWIVVVGVVAVVPRHAPRRAIAVALVLGVLAVGGSQRARSTIDSLWDDSVNVGRVAELRDSVLVDGSVVDYWLPVGSNSTVPMMVYQFHLPRTTFTVVHEPTGGDAELVFAPTADEELRANGAVPIWTDPRRPISLWRR